MVADPAFQKETAKRGADLEPTPGSDVQTYSDGIAKAPKEIVDVAAKAIEG